MSYPIMNKKTHATLELKQLDESGVFAGYASVFDVVDSQRDVVVKGAFSESLASGISDVPLLWQHDAAEPIGVIETFKEDMRGLYISGRLLMEVARAREAYSLLQRGVVKGLSIGYTPKRFRIDPDSGVRVIMEVDLWEVSLVTFPANEQAQVTVVKSAESLEETSLIRALDRSISVLLSDY